MSDRQTTMTLISRLGFIRGCSGRGLCLAHRAANQKLSHRRCRRPRPDREGLTQGPRRRLGVPPAELPMACVWPRHHVGPLAFGTSMLPTRARAADATVLHLPLWKLKQKGAPPRRSKSTRSQCAVATSRERSRSHGLGVMILIPSSLLLTSWMVHAARRDEHCVSNQRRQRGVLVQNARRYS